MTGEKIVHDGSYSELTLDEAREALRKELDAYDGVGFGEDSYVVRLRGLYEDNSDESIQQYADMLNNELRVCLLKIAGVYIDGE